MPGRFIRGERESEEGENGDGGGRRGTVEFSEVETLRIVVSSEGGFAVHEGGEKEPSSIIEGTIAPKGNLSAQFLASDHHHHKHCKVSSRHYCQQTCMALSTVK